MRYSTGTDFKSHIWGSNINLLGEPLGKWNFCVFFWIDSLRKSFKENLLCNQIEKNNVSEVRVLTLFSVIKIGTHVNLRKSHLPDLAISWHLEYNIRLDFINLLVEHFWSHYYQKFACRTIFHFQKTLTKPNSKIHSRGRVWCSSSFRTGLLNKKSIKS